MLASIAEYGCCPLVVVVFIGGGYVTGRIALSHGRFGGRGSSLGQLDYHIYLHPTKFLLSCEYEFTCRIARML